MIARTTILAAILALVADVPASAQPQTVLPRAKDGRLENLVRVAVPSVRSMALSDSLGLLAFCRDGTAPEARVTLIRLDAKGQPLPESLSWKLPRPKEPAKAAAFAVSAVFHPKLPLLYVWQELAVPFPNPPQLQPADIAQFDHLLIYNVAKSPPELVVALCRGPGYVYGKRGGGLAVDASGDFLYVPNLRDLKAPNNFFFGFGRFHLDAEGLPDLGDTANKESAAVRAKKLAAHNVSPGVRPEQETPLEYVYIFNFSDAGTGTSFIPISRDVVIGSNWSCLVSWRPGDKTAALSSLPLKVGGVNLLSRHPRLPVVYTTPVPSDSIFRVAQVEGYLTLLPHQYTFPGARLTSPPVVLGKSNKLAVGGQYQLYVADLDAQGELRPNVQRIRVLSPQVLALAYSERFDKLYVGVEVSK